MYEKKSLGVFTMIEMILAIIIAGCVIMVLYLNNVKDSEMTERYMETLLVPAEQIGITDTELTELVTEYQPESAKMIEFYTEELNLVYRVRFNGNATTSYQYQLRDYPDLMNYLLGHNEGHTNYIVNGVETDVYFKWCKSESYDRQELIIIYSSRPEAQNYWLMPLTCYIILMCSFSIVLISTLKRGRERVIQYSKNQCDIVKAMIP